MAGKKGCALMPTEIAPFAQVRHHQPGQIIYMEENRAYYLRSGRALVKEVHRNGRELLFDIVQPDYVTEGGCGRWVCYELHVQQTGEIITLDVELLHSHNGAKWIEKIRDFAKRTQFIASIVRHQYVAERLMHMLIFLSQHYVLPYNNEALDGWITLPPFTHEELATCISSTRATVSKLLKQMEADGLIRYKHHRYSKLIQLSPALLKGE